MTLSDLAGTASLR